MVRKIILLKCECQILPMGLSTADSKQVLCRMILFKVLSLSSLWFQQICKFVTNSEYDIYLAKTTRQRRRESPLVTSHHRHIDNIDSASSTNFITTPNL